MTMMMMMMMMMAQRAQPGGVRHRNTHPHAKTHPTWRRSDGDAGACAEKVRALGRRIQRMANSE
eukprot:1702770-Rhodomonas_salina.2